MGSVVFSELTCYLKKGLFYKCGNKIYLVGANVPAIANVYVCEVTKEGDLCEIDVMYYRQNKDWKINDNIVIKDKYKEYLQELFCYGYGDFVDKKRKHNLPPVYQYLECGRQNTIKKYAISKGEKVKKFMQWVKDNCRYYAPDNALVYYSNMTTNEVVGYKSDEELYNIYKQKQELKLI